MRRFLPLSLSALGLIFAGLARGEDFSQLPSYQPAHQVSGTIRSWGHGFLKAMMKRWEKEFQQYQPNIRFQDDLVSSAAAMAGLYCGRADLGILAREITPPEVAAYEKVTKQKITPVTVLTGSFSNPDKIMALGIFVHRDNPIAELSFSQLDAIFGSERRRGEKENLRTWGQLGLSGEWARQRIHPLSALAYETPGYVFSQTVLKGSVLWNCDLRQFADLDLPGGKTLDGYRRALNALAADRYGIALSSAGYADPQVKLVALAAEEGGPFVPATRENVISRAYPLSRSVKFYINNGPALPADPKVIEFLRYILSREGQKQVLGEGDFLPLTVEAVRAELQKLPHPPAAP